MYSFRVFGSGVLFLIIIEMDTSCQWSFEYKCPNETTASTSHTICCGRCDHMSYTSCQVNVPILVTAVLVSFVLGVLAVVISDVVCSLRCARGYTERILSALRCIVPGLSPVKSRAESRRNIQLSREDVDVVLAAEMNCFNGHAVEMSKEDDNYDGISETCRKNVIVHNF
uniref:Membrane protein m39 n=1 Tax=Mastomys natalensis cytomegalovirus 2 TaxID=2973540 RepID=A0A9Y1IM98_9BETA|nr:membrane protein m39 [Mastomys natalensis cytomegalovirus 2]WEG69181.1 membrane protein m39 [Mastomys natalensis cytomegalovirus 2]WEG69320.1 membrane protein m39 [Mastomys natalensis cytomegalovirus 2]WEG69458.1 membrane protein m39 [Mastomys natalensis cytomegalovirus 2]WEG69596.1 membrane protein m39 [Mastomys natalensis cytomegalovirus 2]